MTSHTYSVPMILRRWSGLSPTVLASRLTVIVVAEGQRLRPVFESAGAVLAPHAASEAERAVLDPAGLANAHKTAAQAHGVLMLSMLVMLEEGMQEISRANERAFFMPLYDALGPDLRSAYNFEPEGGSTRTNRMFGVGRFGFI